MGVQVTVDPAFPRNSDSAGRHPAARKGDDQAYSAARHLYDVMQSSHRMVVECFFGILCSRFRVLRGTYECGGAGWEQRFSRMIRVCALLHNLCISHKATSVDDVFVDLPGDDEVENAGSDSDDEADQEQHAVEHGILPAGAPAPLPAAAKTPSEQAAAIRRAVTAYLSRRYELNLTPSAPGSAKPSRKMSYRLKSVCS